MIRYLDRFEPLIRIKNVNDTISKRKEKKNVVYGINLNFKK